MLSKEERRRDKIIRIRRLLETSLPPEKRAGVTVTLMPDKNGLCKAYIKRKIKERFHGEQGGTE